MKVIKDKKNLGVYVAIVSLESELGTLANQTMHNEYVFQCPTQPQPPPSTIVALIF